MPQTNAWIKTKDISVTFKSPTILLTTTVFTDNLELPKVGLEYSEAYMWEDEGRPNFTTD